MRSLLRRALGLGEGVRRAAAKRPPSRKEASDRAPQPRAGHRAVGAFGQGPSAAPRQTFWCSAVAYPHSGGRPVLFGACPTRDARRSVRWLQMRVEQLADQLNVAHARPGRAWAQDETAAETAMKALVWGESYTVTLVDDDAVYVFTAQPNTGGEPLLPGREASWPV